MSAEPHPTHERLLENPGWVRSVARALVEDPHLVDDLAQEACVAALANPPSHAANLRGWLGAVMANALRQSRRSGDRRRAREERAAVAERLPDTADVLARASSHQAVVQAVLELDEPYRRALLLRWFDELPPREIARRLGLPVATVHTQLQRGLERLRARFRDAGAERRAWLLAVWRLAHEPSGPPTPTSILGVLLVNKLVLVAAAAAVGLAVLAAWPEREPAGAASPVSLEPVAASAPTSAVREARAPDSGERTAVRPPEPVAVPPLVATPADAALATTLVQGRVFDPEGRPARGVLVAYRSAGSDALTAESDAGGQFELEVPLGFGRFRADSEELTTVVEGVLRRDSTIPPVVVVARRVDLAGRVVDAAGGELAGVRVRLALPRDFDERFPEILDASRPVDFEVASGDDGSFALADVPAVPGAELSASRVGYWSASVPEPETARDDLVLALRSKALEPDALAGRVVDATGRPAPFATVALGTATAEADDEGRFGILASRFDRRHDLVAVRPGHRPGRVAAPPAGADGDPEWPAFVEVGLGAEPLSVAGRVVDAEGGPRAGIRVWLADPTVFGYCEDRVVTQESVAAGESPRELVARVNAGGRGPDDVWAFVETGEDGAFRLDGLDARDYRLRAFDPATLAMTESEPVGAGSRGVTLVLADGALRPRVAGRVVAADGTPLARIRVTVVRRVARLVVQREWGDDGRSRTATGDTVQTDDAGRFELRDVPEDVFLALGGDEILPDWIELASEPDPERLEAEVQRRCHFRVDASGWDALPDRIEVRDGDGRTMGLFVIRDRSDWEDDSAPLAEGRSGVLTVGERARTLRLLRAGELVGEVALRLVPGEVVDVVP